MIGTMLSLVRRRPPPEPEAAPPPPLPPEPPIALVAEVPRVPHWQAYDRQTLMQIRAEDERNNARRLVVALWGGGIPPMPGIGKARLVPGLYRVRASNEQIRVYDAKGEELGINASGTFVVSDHRVVRTKYDNDGLAEITFNHGKGAYLISRVNERE